MIRQTRSSRTPWTMAVVLLILLTGVLTASAAAAPAPRASFNDIEDEVMCVTCNVPLNIAESVQADEERVEIKRLIAQGLTKQQILDKLVDDLGPQVLADPPSNGFNVTTWLVPVVGVGGVAAFLLLLLPRWRRRTQDETGAALPAGPSLSSDDLRRLDEDLAATDR